MSAAAAAAVCLALALGAGGLIYRILVWLRTPAPLRIPLTPAPLTHAGVALRLAREALLFTSLWRATPATWLLGWPMHLALALIVLGHLRYFAGWWREWPSTHALATVVGLVFLLSLAGLLARRALVERVRRVSAPSDYLMLLLLIALGASGLALARFDAAASLLLRDFVRALAAGELAAFPDSSLAWIHLLLALVLFAIAPFSKLMHAPGLFFSPTRYQRDAARLPRAVP